MPNKKRRSRASKQKGGSNTFTFTFNFTLKTQLYQVAAIAATWYNENCVKIGGKKIKKTLNKHMKVKKQRKPRLYSPMKQKVLLLLAAGVSLSFAGTLGRQWRILEDIPREWKKINRQYLYRIVHEFYDRDMVDVKENKGGTVTISLTEQGRERAVIFDDRKMRIERPSRWDGRWHVVLFDIPEKYKKARESLRLKLRELGFCQLQKSVFVHPYPCREHIDFIAAYFDIRLYVRYAIFTDITNEAELRLHFGLT